MSHEFILDKLKLSKFRGSFRLGNVERGIVEKKGLEVIREHARKMLKTGVGSLSDKDGQQTPLRGHPVFIAQHATATCCRKCLSKWHGLPLARDLSEGEIDYFADLVTTWVEREMV